jgi:4-hydroxy-tetrahydrodipicolinate synthase
MTHFKGVFTALITPFTQDGHIDNAAFSDLVEWQISESIHGLVPCGTTGECATLSHEEHTEVVRLCTKIAKGRVPVIAGTGSNSTAEAIDLSLAAQRCGVDGLLIVTPYYNKPSQAGLFAHFKAIHDATSLPIVLYNVPGRTGVDLHIDTIQKLASLPRITAIKDATGDLERPLLLRNRIGHDFSQLSGDDGTSLAFYAHGGCGAISVTSNIAPKQVASVFNHYQSGQVTEALAIQESLSPLNKVMFCESNPLPVKYAASLLKRCQAYWRLPLTTPSDTNCEQIRNILRSSHLLID